MSEGDSFIREVSEEVQKDRLVTWLRRNALWIGLGVVAIIGGAGTNEWFKAQARAEAEARGDALWASLNTEDAAERLSLLPEGGGDDPITVMEYAAAQLNAEDTGAAVAALQKLAGNGDLDPALRDVARLKLVAVSAEEIGPAERMDILARLLEPGHALRALALEQRALIHLETGDAAAAIEDLETILTDPTALPGVAERVQQLLVALGSRGSTHTDG